MDDELEEVKRQLVSEEWIRTLNIVDDLIARGYVEDNRRAELELHFAKKILSQRKSSVQADT